jgi:hypothetical protein
VSTSKGDIEMSQWEQETPDTPSTPDEGGGQEGGQEGGDGGGMGGGQDDDGGQTDQPA